MSKPSYIIKTLMILVIISAAVAGFIVSNNYFNKKPKLSFKTLLVYPDAKAFTGFKLKNKDNQELTIEDFKNQWTLLFFGFTSCPDVCPTTLAELQKVYKQLKIQNVKILPQVLFVSVDPDRDTPEVLTNYINFFNPEFNAASTDNANLISLTSQVGVAYHVEEHEKNQKIYNVDHTAAIFVINPDKKLYGIFPTPHVESDITSDLIQLLGQK